MAAEEMETLATDGFVVCRQVVPRDRVEHLRECIADIVREEAVKPFGIRSIVNRCPEVGQLASSELIRQLVGQAIDGPFQLVRSILFDKFPGANWSVGWHQDLSIAVKARSMHCLPGFRNWSEKDGVPHVQAPAELLGRMATLRIHLDDAEAGNGPLLVIPGSHAFGRLESPEIEKWVGKNRDVTCALKAGDILLMRPSILHASRRATPTEGNHRRVIHLEYAPTDGLPSELEWYEDAS